MEGVGEAWLVQLRAHGRVDRAEMPSSRSVVFRLMLAAAISLLLPAASMGAERKGPKLELDSLATRAETITGADALIGVLAPGRLDPAKVRVRLNGRDVTSAFAPDATDPDRVVGLVEGLREGRNRLAARIGGKRGDVASLSLINSPTAGPVFSGPHQEPYVCRTQEAGLGAPLDEDCTATAQVDYYYRSTGGGFKRLASPTARPADLAQTTTRDGQTVDYVVRVESGTINRAVYRWAVLADGGETAAGWNGRLVYRFGGSCTAGHQQGTQPLEAVLSQPHLSRGFAVASSSLNRFVTSCNDVLSAETAAMVKERIAETIGRPPVWTVGEGGSGGSIQQHMIATNYPGILDGILPAASGPDNSFPEGPDCVLIDRFFEARRAAGQGFSAAERRAITGFGHEDTCDAFRTAGFGDIFIAGRGCDPVVPAALRYNATTNPTGARCTIWDSLVNVYGRDPATGWARRTLDNVGVQYGLGALRDGTITPGEFLALNEEVGGFDNNGAFTDARAIGDPEAIAIAFRTGRINQAGPSLGATPMLDIRNYNDDIADVHHLVSSFFTRARLQAANPDASNQVIWRIDRNTDAITNLALDTMSTWLDRIEADDSDRTQREKVLATKPAEAVDACWTPNGQRIDEPAAVGAAGACNALYPPHATPRMVSGQGLGSPTAKCVLRPIDLADYPPLSPLQEARLRAAFPGGVCDWTRPGIGEQPLTGTWLSFGPDRSGRSAKRKLGLDLRTRGERTVLRATLRPCPEVSWQRIVFERKRGKRWRPLGSEVAAGGKCRASVKVRVPRGAALRALAPKLDGFAGARSKPKRAG